MMSSLAPSGDVEVSRGMIKGLLVKQQNRVVNPQIGSTNKIRVFLEEVSLLRLGGGTMCRFQESGFLWVGRGRWAQIGKLKGKYYLRRMRQDVSHGMN